jgi:glycosyltransferase involved in cell wall biosynthesis
MQKKKLSIVTPTYNRVKLLPRLWKSISKQTFTSFYWVVIDDGSTDGTGEYFKTIDDDRVAYFWQENQGYNNARNQGANKRPADYLVFIDDDDAFYNKHTLSDMVNDIENTPDDVAVLAYRAIDQNGKIRCRMTKSQLIVDYQDMICGSSVSGEFIYIFKGNVFPKYQWPSVPGLDSHILWDISKTSKLLYSEKIGRVYHINDNQRHSKNADNMSGVYKIIEKAPNIADGLEVMFRKHGASMKAACCKVFAKKKFYLALNYAISGDKLNAFKNLKESLKNRGPKIRIILLLLSLFLPLFVIRKLFIVKTKAGFSMKSL